MHCTGGAMIGCWSTKGGSGTTVVAAALALSRAASGASVRLVDACGDLPAALGICEPTTAGLSEWLASSRPEHDDLAGRFIPVTAHLSLLPRGSIDDFDLRPDSVSRLAKELQRLEGCTIVDFGQLPARVDLRECGMRSILIVRPCYLALRRATKCPKPDAIIVVEEPGRALVTRDIEQVVGAPMMATVPIDPTIARSVDAGLLGTRLPPLLAQSLDGWA